MTSNSRFKFTTIFIEISIRIIQITRSTFSGLLCVLVYEMAAFVTRPGWFREWASGFIHGRVVFDGRVFQCQFVTSGGNFGLCFHVWIVKWPQRPGWFPCVRPWFKFYVGVL